MFKKAGELQYLKNRKCLKIVCKHGCCNSDTEQYENKYENNALTYAVLPVIPCDPVAIGPSCLLFNLHRFCAPEFGAECFKKESL